MGIPPILNILARLEFEIIYYNATLKEASTKFQITQSSNTPTDST